MNKKAWNKGKKTGSFHTQKGLLKIAEVARKRMLSDNNPMKNPEIVRKMSDKMKGRVPWCKGKKLQPLSDKRKKENSVFMKSYRKNHPNPMKNKITRQKMSVTRKKRIKQGLIVFTRESRENSSRRMTENRKDTEFNRKMFASFKKQITMPHKIVKDYLVENGFNNFVTNLPMLFGTVWGSIDEADENLKIAIFVDGEYWHNYPDGRRWDKYCKTFLEHKGWKVYRIWVKDIIKNDLINMMPFIGQISK